MSNIPDLEETYKWAVDAEVKNLKKIIRADGYAKLYGGKGKVPAAESVIGAFKKTDKYIINQTGVASWEITKNHNYKPWWKIDWMTLGVTGAITLIAGMALDRLVNPNMRIEIEQFQKRIVGLSDSLNRLNNRHTNHISDTTMHAYKASPKAKPADSTIKK